MQCVLNRLLYVIFDKLPHINANSDFLPEPGGMENISIKQIMLGEQTSSYAMLHWERRSFHWGQMYICVISSKDVASHSLKKMLYTSI